MKKAILPILLLLVGMSCLLAVESEPSTTVGFLKYTVPQGQTNFCLPFTFYKMVSGTLTETMALDDIVGTQMTAGTLSGNADRIINMYNGSAGWLRTSDSHWQTMTSFLDNTPYRFHHRAATTLNVYLAGSVVREVQTVGTFAPGSKLAALREAGAIPVSMLDLNPMTATGFTGANLAGQSDQLSNPASGATAWYKANAVPPAWQGTLTASVPGAPIYLTVRPSHHSVIWNYDPNTRGEVVAPAHQNVSNK
jgi:hypothetical protein